MTHTETAHPRNCNSELTATQSKTRNIVLPISLQEYQEQMATPKTARECIDAHQQMYPHLFPPLIKNGYQLHGSIKSKKMEGVEFQRIRIMETINEQSKLVAYQIRSCDILSYNRGTVAEVEYPLLLMQLGVPTWIIVLGYGRDEMYWYRTFRSFGHYSLVGTTVQDPTKMPEDVGGDEKHTHRNGEKAYIATTVGENCILGVSVSNTADQAGLKRAYGEFKAEATDLDPNYAPKTVNTDGWGATKKVWKELYPAITLILCFLHGYLKIRDRSKKKYKDWFEQIGDKVWEIYRCEKAEEFLEQCTNLEQWAMTQIPLQGTPLLEAVRKLCNRKQEYVKSYAHPTCLRTSNMIDRKMKAMDKWLFNRQYFSGHLDSSNDAVRAWALLHNFRPYCPRAKIRKEYQSPAHQLNKIVYRENWLENLLVSTSCQPIRRKHRKS